MYPNLNDLYNFIETCRAGNLTLASKKIGITQSGLSQSIQRLEKKLNSKLLFRFKKGVKPTPIGNVFLKEAQSIVDQWTHIENQHIQNLSEISGRVSLGVHVSVAQYALFETLPAFLKKNQNLEIQLQHENSRMITEKVIQGECDLGIAVNPVAHPDLVMIELCKDEVTVWSIKPKRSLTLICDPNLLQTQKIISKSQKYKRHIHSSSLEIVRNFVECGVGDGILPGRVAALAAKKLYKIGNETIHDKIYLIHRFDLPKTRAMSLLISTILEHFKN